MPLGIGPIDRQLPGGGLALGALHELFGDMAATGFAATLLARFAAQGPIFWIGPDIDLYAPGLQVFGLEWRNLILVRARQQEARLWALEEALQSPGVAAALAEIDHVSLTSSRRLQLASEAKGVTAFLLLPARAQPAPSAASTRWRISTLPGSSLSQHQEISPGPWQIELFRCRGGRPFTTQLDPARFTGSSAARHTLPRYSTEHGLAKGKPA